MATVRVIGGSYLQGVKWREERAVIHEVRCLELMENLFGGDSLELQFLPTFLGLLLAMGFPGASVDLGCNLVTRVMSCMC